jgi:hypothetical protein
MWLEMALMEEKPAMKRTKKSAMIIPYMEVASWWSCWQLVVELSVEKHSTMWLVAVEVEVMVVEEKKSDND